MYKRKVQNTYIFNKYLLVRALQTCVTIFFFVDRNLKLKNVRKTDDASDRKTFAKTIECKHVKLATGCFWDCIYISTARRINYTALIVRCFHFFSVNRNVQTNVLLLDENNFLKYESKFPRDNRSIDFLGTEFYDFSKMYLVSFFRV